MPDPPASASQVPLRELIHPLALQNYGARFWLVDLSQEAAADDCNCLSVAECERMARFVFAADRRRFQISHAALRTVLARECDTNAAGIEFMLGAHGKPALASSWDCAFNMSHSDDLALIAVARGLPEGAEIGVDLEASREIGDLAGLAAANFTERERNELVCSAPAQRNGLFLCGWTRKEACLKAVGSGLSIAPATFDCTLAPVRALTRIPTDAGLRTVEVESIDVRDGYLAAIAVTVPAADR